MKPVERSTEEEDGTRKGKEREKAAAAAEDGGRARGDRSVHGREEAAG